MNSSDEAVEALDWPQHWTDDQKLSDLHARYHDEPGNILGKDDCAWDRCPFWDVASFAFPLTAAAVHAEAVADERRRIIEQVRAMGFVLFGPDDLRGIYANETMNYVVEQLAAGSVPVATPEPPSSSQPVTCEHGHTQAHTYVIPGGQFFRGDVRLCDGPGVQQEEDSGWKSDGTDLLTPSEGDGTPAVAAHPIPVPPLTAQQEDSDAAT